MHRRPLALHEDHEHHALLVLIFNIVLLVAFGAWWLAQRGAIPSRFWETIGVVLTVCSLFFGAYWLAVFILRRLPQDALDGQRSSVPFAEPAEWTSILNQIPNVAALLPNDRQRLGRFIDLFLRHVHIEGGNDLEITPTVRLTLAAQACLLALNLPRGALGGLTNIIVYPTTFLPSQFSWHAADADLPVAPTLGQSWQRGTVVLAWDNVLEGVANPSDGHNVALHEFAHQLDALHGTTNGIPPLGSRHRYLAWSGVLEASFARFSRQVRKGKPGSIDPYGATNPAEFFAVATESFFERPDQLKREYPELYEQLRNYYRQDRAAIT